MLLKHPVPPTLSLLVSTRKGQLVSMLAHLPPKAAVSSSDDARRPPTTTTTTLMPTWILARLSCLWDLILRLDKVHMEK